jgi:NADPH:quinone reductase-like Zn-dependent oxidoreductase
VQGVELNVSVIGASGGVKPVAAAQHEMGLSPPRSRAVRFDHYGGREVLSVVDVPVPIPEAGEVVVAVRAAGINPGEAAIRSGALRRRFPATFPSGEGSDLAGVVSALGHGVDEFAVGDEVLGFSLRRSSHATHVVVPTDQLIRKPPELSWEVAGSLYVVGCTAYAAVRAIDTKEGDTVAVSAAAGGVGTTVVQLLGFRGAKVLGIASPANAEWLASHGAVPVAYGEGLADRLRAAAPSGIDAFIDLFGPEYVQLAADLGIPRPRIETITSFEKAEELGTKAEGSGTASTVEVLSEMADLVASNAIEIPIAATYPLDRVADAFEQLEKRHTRGKIVLIP